MFDDIAQRWPEIGERFDYWETGKPLPPLNDTAAILFQLQDPLLETFPDCYQDALELVEAAEESGTRIINSPVALSNTIKTKQSQIWCQANLPTPRCIPFQSIEQLHQAAFQIDGPMIIKADNLHAQKRTLVPNGFAALQQIPVDQIPIPGSLSPLIDTRSGYAKLDPQSPYATHFHKKRAMVFGDHVQNNHVFFSDRPVVGCMSSTFEHFRRINPIKRYTGNLRCKSHVQCDIDFHYSEPDDARLLSEAARLLGVEFCAIDYSTHADGSIVLWEANPYFSLHRWPITVLGRQRRLQARTPRIHAVAATFLRELLSLAS
ncbi:MAG: hypothetical protein AB8B91_07995 [Rubripirellula sp.]